MKVAQIVTGLGRANGVTVFVENVVRELQILGHEVKIITPSEKAIDYRMFDVVHLHGLWHPWLHRQAVKTHKCGKKVVWSPHGMLTEWAMHNHWWKKYPFWFLWQRRDLRRATAIHVTAQNEVEDVRRLGFRNRLIMAPLGVVLETGGSVRTRSSSERILLFVGRIHPIKGLDRLLKAYSRIGAKNWKLRIVGPDQEGYTDELRHLTAELGVADSVEFAGPRYGRELKVAYADADCLILPSHTENFGSVVVEALEAGIPVVATKGTPWRDLEDYNCGWWADGSVEGIECALREMVSLSGSELAKMGKKGRELVEKKYTWPAVAEKLSRAYDSMLNDSLS